MLCYINTFLTNEIDKRAAFTWKKNTVKGCTKHIRKQLLVSNISCGIVCSRSGPLTPTSATCKLSFHPLPPVMGTSTFIFIPFLFICSLFSLIQHSTNLSPLPVSCCLLLLLTTHFPSDPFQSFTSLLFPIFSPTFYSLKSSPLEHSYSEAAWAPQVSNISLPLLSQVVVPWAHQQRLWSFRPGCSLNYSPSTSSPPHASLCFFVFCNHLQGE